MDRGSVFDKGPETRESLVPFGGNLVEVVAQMVHRFEVQFEQATATGTDAADNASLLENAQVFGDGLACEVRAMGELRDGPRSAAAEP